MPRPNPRDPETNLSAALGETLRDLRIEAGFATYNRWQRVVYDEPRTRQKKVYGPLGSWTYVPEAYTVFIAPPSREALRERLVGRGSDAPDQVERRLRVAEEEMAAEDEFDRVIVNDDLSRAVQELGDLVATMWQL